MELAKKAERRTNMMTWVGLGLMSVQFGILARLTWWEYSWDIMEPVTYFVTYGTTMAMYAYYCVTKRVSKRRRIPCKQTNTSPSLRSTSWRMCTIASTR